MTLQRANEIEAAVRSADQVTIDLVQVAYSTIDIDVNGETLRCKEYRGDLYVTGPALVNFSMPVPQWFRAAMAGGNFESAASRQAWSRDAERRAVEIAANRNPEGIDADAADRY